MPRRSGGFANLRLELLELAVMEFINEPGQIVFDLGLGKLQIHYNTTQRGSLFFRVLITSNILVCNARISKAAQRVKQANTQTVPMACFQPTRKTFLVFWTAQLSSDLRRHSQERPREELADIQY